MKNVEVGVVLRHSFDVSLLVESASVLNVIFSCLLFDDLVRCTHFKETSRGVVVTIKDSLDNSFNFWSLNQIENLKFNGNL